MMVVFDIRPIENHLAINDMQKVTSAYTKTNDGVSFVENSFVMYADKKRATSMLRSIGFQMPIELLQSDYIGSITYQQRSVNIHGEKFYDVFRKKTTENKYSREMDTVKALERQNELLKKRVEYWKGQTKRTTAQKADSAEVRKMARELLGQYDSSTKAAEIMDDLQWLADQWANGGSNADYSDMMDCANRIARNVLEGSGVDVNADMAETRKELRQYLRTTPINVTDTIKADIGDFGDWKKQNRGLRFREDGSGTAVDSMWLDLQDRFGEGMFPDSVMNPSDQVQYIADKLRSMEADIQNPYQADMELAVQQLTMDIMNRAQGLNPEKPTKKDAAVERETEELRQLLEVGRTRENERIKKAQQTELRQKIRGISDKFQRMVTKPGKGVSQHAPVSLSKAVADFCDIFNESELRRMERWQNSIQGRADRLAQRMGNPIITKAMMEEYRNIETAKARMDRTTAKLTKLKNAYLMVA